MVFTLCLCVLHGSQNRQLLLPHTALADWFCITEVESVYCAVRTESLYKQKHLVLKWLNASIAGKTDPIEN